MYETSIKSIPPINATRKIAFGTFFFGSTVSSENAVTASKPRKDKQRIEAPERTKEKEASESKSCKEEKNKRSLSPSIIFLIDKITNRAVTKNRKRTSIQF